MASFQGQKQNEHNKTTLYIFCEKNTLENVHDYHVKVWG